MAKSRSPRLCRLCRQPGHRADTCPTASASGGKQKSAANAPRSPRELVAILVGAASSLGEAKALAAVEEATREVLQQTRALRLALVRSRAANARLRAQVEDEKIARDLARLDRAEAGER